MRKQSWLNLILSVFLILTACQPAVTNTPSAEESAQENDAPGLNPADPSSTPDVTNGFPIPELSERQQMEFLNTVNGILAGPVNYPEEQYDLLSGAILMAETLNPSFLKLMSNLPNFDR